MVGCTGGVHWCGTRVDLKAENWWDAGVGSTGGGAVVRCSGGVQWCCALVGCNDGVHWCDTLLGITAGVRCWGVLMVR